MPSVSKRVLKHALTFVLVQAISVHMEWMLPPAMHLLRCLNALAQSGVLPAPLQPMLELSPLEMAAAIGQQAFLDAKSRVDELEPGRLDPSSIHGVRGWFKQSKELVRTARIRMLCSI